MKRQIEDYLRARGVQYFRGHHDDEYFFFVDFVAGAYRGRLNVHIEARDTAPDEVCDTAPDEVCDTAPDEVCDTAPDEVCHTEPDEVLVTISPDRYYPAEKAQWLGMLADRWNAADPAVQAVVHGSCDPRLVGVQARSRQRPADVAALTEFLEAAVGAGVDLFGRIASAEMPAAEAGLRDAG